VVFLVMRYFNLVTYCKKL